MGGTVRRPTFDRWIRREVMHMAGLERFSLRKIAAAAQQGNREFAAALVLYAYSNKCFDKVEPFIWDEALVKEFHHVSQVLAGRDLETLALRDTPLRALPEEYHAILASFANAYNHAELIAGKKHEIWQRTHELQLHKGITNSEIYQALGLNHGNVNSYLKDATVNKVSLKNAEAILAYVESYGAQ